MSAAVRILTVASILVLVAPAGAQQFPGGSPGSRPSPTRGSTPGGFGSRGAQGGSRVTPPRSSTPKKFDKSTKRAKGSSDPASTTPRGGARGGGGGGGRGGAAGGGRGGRRGPSPAVKRAVKRALEILRGSRRILRRDSTAGVITVVDRTLARREVRFKAARRYHKDGSESLLVRHGRGGDLPDEALLGKRDKAGKTTWWRHRPEERRTSKPSATDPGRVIGGALTYTDLLPLDIADHEATFVGLDTHEGKKAYRYTLTAGRGSPTTPPIEVVVRADTNVIAEIAYSGADGRLERKLTFSSLRYVGVHKRWTKWVVQDLRNGTTTTVRLTDVKVNRGVDDAMFAAGKLGEWLVAGDAPKGKVKKK